MSCSRLLALAKARFRDFHGIVVWECSQDVHIFLLEFIISFVAQPMNAPVSAQFQETTMNSGRDSSMITVSPESFSPGLYLEGFTSKDPHRPSPTGTQLDLQSSAPSKVWPAEVMDDRLSQDTGGNDASRAQGNRLNSNTSFEMAAQNGRNCFEAGRYKKALKCFEDALRQKYRSLHSESSEVKDIFADALHTIGRIHSMKPYRDLAKSIHAFELCLDLQRARFGPKSFPVAAIMNKLAEKWGEMNEHQTAVDILSEALAILLVTKPESQETADTWMGLGRQLKLIGNLEDSEASVKEATRIYELLDKSSL